MKKLILIIAYLIAFTEFAEACGGIKQPDGSWKIDYNFTRSIDGKTYFCCIHSSRYSRHENCKTKEEWISYYERDVGEISYMTDMHEPKKQEKYEFSAEQEKTLKGLAGLRGGW